MNSKQNFQNISEVIKNLPENFSILEETIDIEIQKNYFESMKSLDLNPREEDLPGLIEQLNCDKTTLDQRKHTLQELAISDSVDAFRAIEKYNKKPHEGLREWSILSLQQSRMVLQSTLLDEQQIFISTGLGGKDAKLRYYLIFPYTPQISVSDTQQKLLKTELKFFLEKKDGELEEIEFHQEYSSAMALIPIKAPIPEIITQILEECNQYGHFISDNVMITNIKKFNEEEIIEILNKNKK
jgi:hypothetical protein